LHITYACGWVAIYVPLCELIFPLNIGISVLLLAAY